MLKDIKQIHFIGIGGIGVSALAKLMAHRGLKVSGSDLLWNEIMQDLHEHWEMKLFEGQQVENVPEDADLVVYSGAVPEFNPEREQAEKLGIKQITYGQMLGEVSKEYSTIVVTGTNGKSTTTAMLGKILEAAGYDPTVLVGTYVPGFKHGNLRIGQSIYFVVEGCEYQANMLNMDPRMILLTNIEEDHLDYYRDMDHIRATFQEFVDKLKGKGKCVLNADDPESRKIKAELAVTYGFKKPADYQGVDYGVDLPIPGQFNLENALAATTAAMELGADFELCKKTLENFTGVWRRFERVGEFNGAQVISDYGHHPTAVAATYRATKDFFPGQRVILCFQPHQHSRTKELFEEFVEALAPVEHLIIPEIYGVSGRTEPEAKEVSSLDLVERLPHADYAPDLPTAEQMLRDMVKPGDIVLIMGAGDVDHIARNLTK